MSRNRDPAVQEGRQGDERINQGRPAFRCPRRLEVKNEKER
jgi:hypothetical protein